MNLRISGLNTRSGVNHWPEKGVANFLAKNKIKKRNTGNPWFTRSCVVPPLTHSKMFFYEWRGALLTQNRRNANLVFEKWLFLCTWADYSSGCNLIFGGVSFFCEVWSSLGEEPQKSKMGAPLLQHASVLVWGGGELARICVVCLHKRDRIFCPITWLVLVMLWPNGGPVAGGTCWWSYCQCYGGGGGCVECCELLLWWWCRPRNHVFGCTFLNFWRVLLTVPLLFCFFIFFCSLFRYSSYPISPYVA